MSQTIDNIKDLGAVFTPNILVNEMLDTLPKNVWNKDCKWLEPCVGDGNFVEEILKREQYIDITCIELHTPYCKDFEKRTGLQAINIDFLTYSTDTKYDVIVGNPPYQKPNCKNKKSRGGKSQLYLDFLDKCLNMLKPDGYLLFVHPSNWRKIGNTFLTRILSNMTIHHLVLYQKKVFPNISVNVDWYLIQNGFRNISTTIINDDGSNDRLEINRQLSFISNRLNSKIQNDIIDISNGKHYKVHLSCELHAYTKKHLISKDQDELYKYPLFNTSAQGYIWSKKAHTYQFYKKVIMSNSGKLNPFYDDGILGTTQNSMFILVDSKKEALHIINLLTSERYTFIISICQWGLFRTERKLIEYFGF